MGTKTFGIYPREQYKPPFEKTFEFQSFLNNHGMEITGAKISQNIFVVRIPFFLCNGLTAGCGGLAGGHF